MTSNKENAPPNKKSRLSLSLNKRQRFVPVAKETLDSMADLQVPKNTEISTRWAMKNFQDWHKDYNERNFGDRCPDELLLPTCSKELLNKWLLVYVTETRSKDGSCYPPKSIYSLLTGIFRHMKNLNPAYPNFISKDNPAFSSFHITVDNLFKCLRKDGVGSESRHTEGISNEEENLLWQSNVLNCDDPVGLQRAVFYYNGKCFCLRGGQEHRELGVSQLKRLHDPDRYVYTERASKNRKGGMGQLRVEHKSVTIVANPSVGIRCHVSLLDKYISKLPSEAIKKDYFYCRPLSYHSDDDAPWYSAVPLGKNTLSVMVSKMCTEAGISGNKSNHSLRVSGATSLFSGVPERIIQQRTGHRSVEALRPYERVTDQQNVSVSRILSGEVDQFDTSTLSAKKMAQMMMNCLKHTKLSLSQENPAFAIIIALLMFIRAGIHFRFPHNTL